MILRSCGALLLAAAPVPAAAQWSSSVPVDMQGVWAKHGRCDVPYERLTITAHTAYYGRSRPAKILYDTASEAIEWAEQGVVDNFVMGRSPSILTHNVQGFGMPGAEDMTRCGTKLVRAPWPPLDAWRGGGSYSYKLAMTPRSQAQDPAIQRRYTAEFATCRRGAVTTTANVACLDAEFARQDAELKQTWMVALGRLPSNNRPSLVTAQHYWIADRDDFCRSGAARSSDAAAAKVAYASCRVEQVIRRTIWLERLPRRAYSWTRR